MGAGGQAASRAWQGAVCALLLALCGCSSIDSLEKYYSGAAPLDTPIDWWHQLQGGVIADERPPAPGVGDPYPNLAEVPAKPTPTDAATRQALSARLTAQRDRTTRAGLQDPILPLTPVSQPAAALPITPLGPATPVPVVPPSMSARIEGADAAPPPPAAAAPPAPAAPAAIQAAAAPSAPPRRPAADAPAGPVVSGPVPALPGAAPSIPVLPGIPAATTAAATPRPRPQVDAAFLPGSAVLRPESSDALRVLAARRAGGTVAVLGGGEARSAQPDDQAQALPLAWRRAQAMAGVLLAAGVPTAALRIDAAALARGGIARLID